jgi:hypothetical protein
MPGFLGTLPPRVQGYVESCLQHPWPLSHLPESPSRGSKKSTWTFGGHSLAWWPAYKPQSPKLPTHSLTYLAVT